VPLDFGPLGVCLFFLLSGYVISISLTRYTRGGFLVGRLMRVLPTYAAGFLCTCAVIWFSGDPAHELTLRSVITGMFPGLSWAVQRSAPADGIVWTLVIELVFYALCLMAYRSLGRRWWVVAIVAAGCAVAQFGLQLVPAGTFAAGVIFILLLACPFIPVMLIGTVVAARTRGDMTTREAAILIPALAVLNDVLLWLSPVQVATLSYRLTYALGIIAFVLIAAFAKGWRGNRVLDFGASISYPIYVVHPVLGYALLWVLTNAGVWWWVAIPITIAAAVLAAWLLHIAVENPTHRIGQRWARHLRDRSRRADGRSAVGSPVS
jgi:peptidoglycan/LPS O-acetylase OafA/YrhL